MAFELILALSPTPQLSNNHEDKTAYHSGLLGPEGLNLKEQWLY